MRVYLDSSALAKRYVREPGTDRVNERCREAREIALGAICVPEIVSALSRLLREGHLGRRQYSTLKAGFAADVEQASMVPMDEDVLGRAVTVIERIPLKALDAVHIASGLSCSCDLFVTADRRQARAARRAGLTVEVVGS